MTAISYRYGYFPPVIIQHTVWLYARFTLSFRDVEELLAERGIQVCYESIRRVRRRDRRNRRLTQQATIPSRWPTLRCRRYPPSWPE